MKKIILWILPNQHVVVAALDVVVDSKVVLVVLHVLLHDDVGVVDDGDEHVLYNFMATVNTAAVLEASADTAIVLTSFITLNYVFITRLMEFQ